MKTKRPVISLAAMAIAACIAAPSVAHAQASNPFIGEIIEVPFNFCPAGWEPTNGQLIAITSDTALFSLIGTTFGGDGQHTFALPYLPPLTLRDGTVITRCISMFGVFPSRN